MLRNGQTVQIITAKGATPNPAWVNFVVTAKARTAIRHYLKNLRRGEAIDLGRRLLKQALAEMKTDLGNLRIAEEAYWADHGQYTINQALLDYRTGSRVTVTLTTTDPFAGFDAEAIHVSAPGVICKMYVGRAAAATPSGEVKCK